MGIQRAEKRVREKMYSFVRSPTSGQSQTAPVAVGESRGTGAQVNRCWAHTLKTDVHVGSTSHAPFKIVQTQGRPQNPSARFFPKVGGTPKKEGKIVQPSLEIINQLYISLSLSDAAGHTDQTPPMGVAEVWGHWCPFTLYNSHDLKKHTATFALLRDPLTAPKSALKKMRHASVMEKKGPESKWDI